MQVHWFEPAQLWWPLDDTRPQKSWEWCSKYLKDCDHAHRLCSRHRTVVQAGGHVGMWPRRLATQFQRVITFEVQPSLQVALAKNCEAFPNIEVNAVGLGAYPQYEAPLERHCTPGSWRIAEGGDFITSLTTIDSFKLKDCDAIILDIEGYEVEALTGAMDTIKACRPLLHVEELPNSKEQIKAFMRRIGYVEVYHVHRDVVYQPVLR